MNKPSVTHFMYKYYYPPLATSTCTKLSELSHHNSVHFWCHSVLCRLSPSAVNCIVSQSAPFCCQPFCSSQFLTSSTHPNPKPDTLPHNVLLSTKWRAISVRWVIRRRLQQSDGATNCFCSKITNVLLQDSSDLFLPLCPLHTLPFTVRDGRSCSVPKC